MEKIKNLEEEILTRNEAARYLKVGLSFLDKIPETELPRVRFGKSVRFVRGYLDIYVKNHLDWGKK